MIDIVSTKGEKYSYDHETGRIFKDGFLMTSTQAEPVFSNTSSGMPKFSGIYLKESGSILTISGNLNPLCNPNSIQ